VLWPGSFTLALFLLITATLPAAAQPPIVAKWVLDVRFENNAIVADWTGTVTRGTQVLRTWVDDVSAFCVVNDPLLVTVGADSAMFAGGTINCNLPSFQQRVFEETQGRLFLANSCQASGSRLDVWLQATLRDPDFSAGGMWMPFANHPDFGLRMGLQDGGAADASLILDAGAMTTESTVFPLAGSGVAQLVGSRINPCNSSQCRAKHQVDGQLITQQTISMSALSGTTGPTTITLGSDGVDYYYGDILDIHIDPGCPATTG
jgi:hypothetical protein